MPQTNVLRATAPPLALAKPYILASIFGLCPVLIVLLSWLDGGGSEASWRYAVQITIAAELILISAAVWIGALKPLPRPSYFVLVFISSLLLIAAHNIIFAAIDPWSAAVWTAIWVLHGLFGVACYRLIVTGAVTRLAFLQVVMAGFAATAVLWFLFATQVPQPDIFSWSSGVPGADHIRRVGYFAAPIGVLAIGYMAVWRTGIRWWAAAVVLMLAFTATFWSGSRGSFYAIIGACGIGVALLPVVRRVAVAAGFSIALCASALLSILIPHKPSMMGLYRVLGIRSENGGPSSDFTTGRTGLWEKSFGAIAERPLLGYGEGQFGWLFPSAPGAFQPVHPHSFPVQMLLGWGAIGTMLLLVIAAPWLWRLVQSVRNSRDDQVPLFLAIVSLIIYSAVDGTLYHVQSAALFAALVGIAYSGSGAAKRTHLPVQPN